ncbi:MAG: hypothetical protein WCK82_09075 [Bacteroidota bacterium]
MKTSLKKSPATKANQSVKSLIEKHKKNSVSLGSGCIIGGWGD